MKCSANIVKVYDTILDETNHKILFNKEGKNFIGALFFIPDETEIIKEVLIKINIEAETEKELVDKCIEFYKANNDSVYKDTEKTMKHWQYINRFTNYIY